jgi:serine/threonine protein kinase/Tol biopolymer transport system component
MLLQAGARLGVYEIVELIGTGGMGEVYRARDVRLNRDVALKTLPALFASDPDRRARFEREAQVLASLNHSNIGAIYGFEESNGVHALVLELVDGPTLADRVAQGPISPDEALPIAKQIAEALETAHERGIVHRDLKPANIKLRRDATVKVLDFGLAKAFTNESETSQSAQVATITSPALTRLGIILGTAAYMSPEQARGKPADKRTDIWAFGCVLYEMLTGKRAFEGNEVSDTLASILKSDPEWKALPAATPVMMRRVLRRCLEKDPRRRFHDIADVRLELEDSVALEPTSSPASASTRPARERAAWGVAALSLVSLIGFASYVALKPAPGKEVTRFQVYPPPDTVLGSGPIGLFGVSGATSGNISPDGTRLVFVATDRSGKTLLWMRSLDSFNALPLTGSDRGALPFWSPDARSIAFFVGSQLKRIDAGGGTPRKICDIIGDVGRGGTWGSGGDILFSSGASPRLYRVPAEGGTAVPLAGHTEKNVAIEAFWPYFLPDGRTFLYWARNSGDGPTVYVASLATAGAPRKLLVSESNAAYDPSGFLLFTRAGVLLRQRFDLPRLELGEDPPLPVAEQIARNTAVGLAAFSVSTTGVLAFQPNSDLTTQFAWFDRKGNLLEKIGRPGSYRYPALSPDGKRLAYLNVNDGNLWILDMTRQTPSKFTTGPGFEASPVWSLGGGTILYRTTLGNGVPGGIFEKSATGAGEEKLFYNAAVNGPSQISPDGKWLLFFANPAGESVQDIFVLPMSGEKKPQAIVQSPFGDVEPQFSPDGRFVAWASSATGGYEVYVQPFPATRDRWQVSNNGGRQPMWRKDGKELFFVSEDRKFYSVEVRPGATFDYDAPKFLFEMRADVFNARNSYIPGPDGQRFLVNMSLDTTAPPIHVVRNWTAGFK